MFAFLVDEKYDQHVYSDGPQAVVWALGPINGKGEVSYHKLRTKGDLFIDFARAPQWNCPKPDDISTVNGQHQPTIDVAQRKIFSLCPTSDLVMSPDDIIHHVVFYRINEFGV